VQEQAIRHCNVTVNCIFLEFFFHLLRISTEVSVPFVTAEQKKRCWKVMLWRHQTPLVFPDRELSLPDSQTNCVLFYIVLSCLASSGSVCSHHKPKPGPIPTNNKLAEKGSSVCAYINTYIRLCTHIMLHYTYNVYIYYACISVKAPLSGLQKSAI